MLETSENVKRNHMNIESLADQVYGLDILTATTGQLAAASSSLTDVASRKQIENFEVFNNMMVSYQDSSLSVLIVVFIFYSIFVKYYWFYKT